MTLYIFNPEHDYALAHNDEHFMTLQSAVQFANDCASFLRYVTDDEEQSLFLPYSTPIPDLSGFHPAHVVPWGWDKLVTHQLRNAGLSDEHLPTPFPTLCRRALRPNLLPAHHAPQGANLLPISPDLLPYKHPILPPRTQVNGLQSLPRPSIASPAGLVCF
ncbi:MAG: hypothetical protein MJZ87_01960 [Bacteroidales bacterium]|nr:hypothetical protein [Bacteroidales bacterium]